MKQKILTMYLPQFHRTKENDAWWGDGFTEWTTVKGAVPLFQGHQQPVVPMQENYYDLLEKKTMIWQVEQMKRYGIDGMCMYHYWFKDGRKILEKPAENLLRWTELPIEYCFCWANETWSRTWSNYGDANVWSVSHEQDRECESHGILLEQQYGNPDAWRAHFEYLLPFFRDTRYIHYDERPVFVIYRPQLIFCLEEMMECWNTWAREAGFAGIYFVCANCGARERKLAQLELIHEPQFTFHHGNLATQEEYQPLRVHEYDDVVEESLRYVSDNRKVSYGGFIGYDDTPRRGSKGVVIHHRTPEKCKKYLQKWLAKNKAVEAPFVFLNAWNEWGEGMHLEPESRDGTDFLEAFQQAKEWKESLTKQYIEQCKYPTKTRISHRKSKEECYMNLLHYWLLKKEMGRSFASYLHSFGYHRVGIYGCGILGKHLISELKGSEIQIVSVIDREEGSRPNGCVPIYHQMEEIETQEMDVLIVTVVYAYDEIKEMLKEQIDTKIISLEQIVMEC